MEFIGDEMYEMKHSKSEFGSVLFDHAGESNRQHILNLLNRIKLHIFLKFLIDLIQILQVSVRDNDTKINQKNTV